MGRVIPFQNQNGSRGVDTNFESLNDKFARAIRFIDQFDFKAYFNIQANDETDIAALQADMISKLEIQMRSYIEETYLEGVLGLSIFETVSTELDKFETAPRTDQIQTLKQSVLQELQKRTREAGSNPDSKIYKFG